MRKIALNESNLDRYNASARKLVPVIRLPRPRTDAGFDAEYINPSLFEKVPSGLENGVIIQRGDFTKSVIGTLKGNRKEIYKAMEGLKSNNPKLPLYRDGLTEINQVISEVTAIPPDSKRLINKIVTAHENFEFSDFKNRRQSLVPNVIERILGITPDESTRSIIGQHNSFDVLRREHNAVVNLEGDAGADVRSLFGAARNGTGEAKAIFDVTGKSYGLSPKMSIDDMKLMNRISRVSNGTIEAVHNIKDALSSIKSMIVAIPKTRL